MLYCNRYDSLRKSLFSNLNINSDYCDTNHVHVDKTLFTLRRLLNPIQETKIICHYSISFFYSLQLTLTRYVVHLCLYSTLQIFPIGLSRNESGRFGTLKSDSTHHFFRNACTKSGSLRFSVFRLLTDFVCLYTYEF